MITLDACGEEIRVGTKVVTEPSVEPVTLDGQKLHARWDGEDLDEAIESYVKVARMQVEERTRTRCLNTTLDLSFDKTPTGRWLSLSWTPLVSVTSVTSYDLDGVATVMSSADYVTDLISQPPRIGLTNGASWPTGLRPMNGLIVRAVFGHGTTAASVDERLRQAIRVLATHYLESPGPEEGAATMEAPVWLDRLLDGLGLVAL